MRILLTGGAGFMGSNMVRFLLNKYPDVAIVNVDKLTYSGNLDNLKDMVGDRRYTFVHADIADQGAMEQVFREQKPEYVLNYAAETHVDRSILEPGQFVITDVIGTYTLLEVARRHAIKKYIQISTDEVFGSVAEGEFTEISPFNPSSPYAASKAGADHLVAAYWKTFRTPTIGTHACNVYGPYQHPEKFIPLLITNLLEGKTFPLYGDGLNVREWIYVPDHCQAIDQILERGLPGKAYNIGTSERLTNLEVVQKVLAILGVDQGVIEVVKDRPGHDRRYALDSTTLCTELGWTPTRTFDHGLAATVRWYRQNEWWWRKVKDDSFRQYERRQYGTS